MPFWKAWLNAMVWNRGDWRLFFSSWVSLKIEPSTSQLELLELAYCQTWCWPLVVELLVNFCPYGLGRSCHSQHSLVSSIRLLVFSLRHFVLRNSPSLWNSLFFGGQGHWALENEGFWRDGWCCISQPEPHRHKERGEHRQGKRKEGRCGVGLVCTEEERWTFLRMSVGLNCLVYGRERFFPNTSFSPSLSPFAGSIQRRTCFCGT